MHLHKGAWDTVPLWPGFICNPPLAISKTLLGSTKSVKYPAEAEYWRALFIKSSPISTVVPSPMVMLAVLKGKVLGFGAPPAREISDGGDLCINSAKVKEKQKEKNETEDPVSADASF